MGCDMRCVLPSSLSCLLLVSFLSISHATCRSNVYIHPPTHPLTPNKPATSHRQTTQSPHRAGLRALRRRRLLLPTPPPRGSSYPPAPNAGRKVRDPPTRPPTPSSTSSSTPSRPSPSSGKCRPKGRRKRREEKRGPSILPPNPSKLYPKLMTNSPTHPPTHSPVIQSVVANGRPTVVDFYAEWCENCKEMAPVLRAMEGKVRGRVGGWVGG